MLLRTPARPRVTRKAGGGIQLELTLHPGARGFSLHARGNLKAGWTRLGGSVEINGSLVRLADASAPPSVIAARNRAGRTRRLVFTFPERGVAWTWDLVWRGRGLEVTARLRNTGRKPLTIGAWNVLHLERSQGGRVRLGATSDPARATFFRWCPWNMGVERLGAGGKHTSDNLCHLHDPASGTTLLAGFVTLDRMRGFHELTCAASGGVAEDRAVCAFGSYELAPGRALVSETLVLSIHADPYEALEHWAERVRRIYRPAFADLPPVGWIDGAWPDSCDCWEKEALANARALRKKLRGFDIRYLWTSQSNLKNAIPGNWLAENRTQIPSGLKRFFRKLRALGFRPGLWVAPYWFYAEAEGMLEANRDNLLQDGRGRPICHAGSWGWSYNEALPWHNLHAYYLDGTHPKTLGFLRRLFGYYRKLGVRYYMLDFLGIVENARLRDPSRTPLEAARAMLKAIREAAGADTHLQTAVSSTPGYVGLIDAARVGRDFGEGRPLQGVPLSDWRNATYVLHDEHYANTRHFLRNVAANYFTHRKLYLNDFNLLTIDKPVPLEHARIAATVFGIGGGSPLMLGDNFRRIDSERLRLVKLCLPRTPASARPADLFDRAGPGEYSRVLTLGVDAAWDGYVLAAVFNLDDTPYRASLDFAKLGLEPAAAHRVFEFWNGEYLGTFTRRAACVIPPQACRLFRISRARPYPWLLATDLHLQQGAVDIRELEWDPGRRRLAGAACRPAGESGNLFFLMPRTWRLVNPRGAFLMKELMDLNVVLRRPVRFARPVERFELFFEPWELSCVSPRGLMPFATEKEWRAYARQHWNPDGTRVFA